MSRFSLDDYKPSNWSSLISNRTHTSAKGGGSCVSPSIADNLRYNPPHSGKRKHKYLDDLPVHTKVSALTGLPWQESFNRFRSTNTNSYSDTRATTIPSLHPNVSGSYSHPYAPKSTIDKNNLSSYANSDFVGRDRIPSLHETRPNGFPIKPLSLLEFNMPKLQSQKSFQPLNSPLDSANGTSTSLYARRPYSLHQYRAAKYTSNRPRGIYGKIKTYLSSLVTDSDEDVSSEQELLSPRDAKRVKFNTYSDYSPHRTHNYPQYSNGTMEEEDLIDNIARRERRAEERSRLMQIQEECAHLRQSLEEAKANHNRELDVRRSDLEQTTFNYQEKIKELERKYEEKIAALEDKFQTKITDLESTCENRQRQIEAQQTKVTELLSNQSQLRQEVQSLRLDRDLRLLELGRREDELISLRKEGDARMLELSKREDELRALQITLQDKDREIQFKQAKLDKLEEEYEEKLHEVTIHESELKSQTAENELRLALKLIKDKYESERLILSREFMKIKTMIERNSDEYERFCIKSSQPITTLPQTFGETCKKGHATIAEEINVQMAEQTRYTFSECLASVISEDKIAERVSLFHSLRNFLVSSQASCEQKLDDINSKIIQTSLNADFPTLSKLYKHKHRCLHRLRLINDLLSKFANLFEMTEDTQVLLQLEKKGTNCNALYHKLKHLLDGLYI